MAWNRENVRGKTWDAFRQDQASCPGSDKSQLGFNFQEVASIYYLYRLSNVRWPKMWSLRSPKLNERLNVQPWSILITPYLISIFYTKKIFSNYVSLLRRIVWCDFQLTSSLPKNKSRGEKMAKVICTQYFFRLLRENHFNIDWAVSLQGFAKSTLWLARTRLL